MKEEELEKVTEHRQEYMLMAEKMEESLKEQVLSTNASQKDAEVKLFQAQEGEELMSGCRVVGEWLRSG